jgi:hypothetical protein
MRAVGFGSALVSGITEHCCVCGFSYHLRDYSEMQEM